MFFILRIYLQIQIDEQKTLHFLNLVVSFFRWNILSADLLKYILLTCYFKRFAGNNSYFVCNQNLFHNYFDANFLSKKIFLNLITIIIYSFQTVLI